MRFLKLTCLLFTAFSCVANGGQGINPELQVLKQQSLLFDRDLLILEDKINRPFSVYLSQNTDARFMLETLVIKLDDQPLATHKYTGAERNSLKKGGAQLLYKGAVSAGPHKLTVYYRSYKKYQGSAELKFNKEPFPQAVEILLQKDQSNESLQHPAILITPLKPAQSSVASVLYRHLTFLKETGLNENILSQIMKAEKLNLLGDDAASIGIIKAQLYQAMDLHIKAKETLQRIIKNKLTAEEIKNKAKFYLAKSYYHLRQNKSALGVLRQLKQPVDKNLRAEMQHLYSLILMSQGKYRQAAKYIRKNEWQAPDNWGLYARLNLAEALIHSGAVNQGSNIIKKMGQKHLDNYEAKSLLDKANQSLGYLLLNQNKPEDARRYLEKVSMNGPYSNLALLGAGWASARLQHYNQAVIPWTELQKKDIREIPVQESMLTLPYAFEKMGLSEKSAIYYKKSVNIYEKELVALNSSMLELKQKSLKSELSQLDISSETAWFKSVNKSAKSKSLRYIKQLIEDDTFFKLLLNFREACLLKNNADIKVKKILAIQSRLLKKAGTDIREKSIKDRDQITSIQMLAADLLKRSYKIQLSAHKNNSLIAAQMTQQALDLLAQRKSRLDSYLQQARLALAQNYNHVNVR